jgi:hypothetical protein
VAKGHIDFRSLGRVSDSRPPEQQPNWPTPLAATAAEFAFVPYPKRSWIMRTSKTSNRRTRKKITAAVGVVSAILAVCTASPAAASTNDRGDIGPASFSNCPVGQICVYAAVNGGEVPGWRSFRATSSGSCTSSWIPTLAGIRGALSVYNRTGIVQKIYVNADCTGSYTRLENGDARENLGTARWSIGGV